MDERVVDKAADELYGLAPADFTEARDERARDLRKKGMREEADAVRALRKPTVPAWAVNQLARRRPKDVKRLTDIGKRLRAAQEALLTGGDRSALKRASAEERELVDELTRDAIALAGEVGTGTSAAVDERIRSTLRAGALDEDAARELSDGRLVREREAVGLFGAGTEAAAPAKPAPPERERTAKEPGKASERRRREAESELSAARSEQRKAERERAAAAKAAARARKQVEAAQRRADQARDQAEKARATLRDAEHRERGLAQVHDRAARAVASAEKKLGNA